VSASNGAEVMDRVKEARAAAVAEGEPPPGRDILVKRLQLPAHQVRQALAAIKLEDERLARERELAATVPAEAASLTQAPAKDTERSEPNGDAGDTPDHDRSRLAPGLEPAGDQVARRPPRPWPLVLIGVAAAVGVWAGWVGLGQMCGWGVISPLPGIRDEFRINTAIALPISVEAYAAYALRVWLSTSIYSEQTVQFARRSAIASLVIGGGAQVAYHLMAAAGYTRAPWMVVTLVALVPVAVLGLASALARLVTNDARAGAST
jgi:hypothetical protein